MIKRLISKILIKLPTVAFLSASLFSHEASAEGVDRNIYTDGQVFLAQCGAFDDPKYRNDYIYGECLGFVSGIHARDIMIRSSRFICLPERATTVQALDVVIKFMRDRPDMRDKPPAIQIWTALAITFPCETQPKAP